GALKNSSLFSGYRLVLLAEAENLKAAQASLIADYLKKPSDSATLIITSSQNSVHKSLLQAVPKKQKEMFWELFENQKKDWLISFFNTQQLEISLEAVDMILSLVENNTQELLSVSQRFASFILSSSRQEKPAEGKPSALQEITVESVEKFVYHSRQESVFTLFAQLAEGNLEASLEIMKTLQLSGEADPAKLFGGILWQFRRLYSYLSFIEEGDSQQEAFNRASVLGKNTSIRGKHNQYIYRTAGRNYSRSEVQRIITALCEFEGLSRELGTALQPIIVERFIYTAVRKKGKQSFTDSIQFPTAVI
ncbi:MAG: DNA polymerase III subunit delta, partial [Spirochaetales bacterium]|nr:DNA polymerase III subunit delta [Spirochaetales bacterium]